MVFPRPLASVQRPYMCPHAAYHFEFLEPLGWNDSLTVHLFLIPQAGPVPEGELMASAFSPHSLIESYNPAPAG